MRFKAFYLWLMACLCPLLAQAAELDSLLQVLDRTIATHYTYAERHEAQIDSLKKCLQSKTLSDENRYRLNNALYEVYKAYVCDSAISYLNRNIELADRMERQDWMADSRIALSYLLSSAGMYIEAVDVLREVDRGSLSQMQLTDYYVACDHAYGELGFYTQDRRNGERYEQKARLYKDSIYQIADVHSELYLSMHETTMRDAGRLTDALEINNERLARTRSATRDYAIVMYGRALIYREAGDEDRYMACLAASAIADIRSAVKDHASLWMLAQALFNRGELERAYRYMDFSWSETEFYNARLRAWQSVEDLSLIESTYQVMLKQRNFKLLLYMIGVSVLSLLLLLALFYIWRQMKRLAMARRDLLEANNRLKELNEELKQTNASLQSTNMKLTEANAIKEGYIARFIKLCSTYVDRLDAYRRMVNKKITSNQVGELLKISRSDSVREEALEELYANFDSVFLHIFPDFVKKFNELLRPEEQIVLKNSSQLNTELRIFALIRLGITDSSQIAEFLHYSVNTIYNYRAKVKNKAQVSREDFEELVMRIS